METKILELRDRGTFIPILCIRLLPDTARENYLLRRAGFAFAPPLVQLVNLTTGQGGWDEYEIGRGARTLPIALQHIRSNWDDIENGEVVDVQYILGETEAPKISEELTTLKMDPNR